MEYNNTRESKVGDEVYQVETEANITQAKHTIQCKLNVDFQELI